MKITFKDICWFAVVALIIFYLSKCHNTGKVGLAGRLVALNDKILQDSIQHRTQVSALVARMELERQWSDSASYKAEVARARLDVSHMTISRLTAALKKAKLAPIDSAFVTVAPDYIIYCDSLADVTENSQYKYTALKAAQGLVVAGKDRQLQIQDSLIVAERTFARQCRAQYADLQLIYGKIFEDGKPRNQVFIGAEVMGTQQSLLNGVGAVLSLKTKRNNLLQVSSGVQSKGQVYGRINANILLTFKR